MIGLEKLKKHSTEFDFKCILGKGNNICLYINKIKKENPPSILFFNLNLVSKFILLES